MELILLENILNLGNIGDKVVVKNGYGRNFLLKKGKALRFSPENKEFVLKKKDELNKKNNEKATSTRLEETNAPHLCLSTSKAKRLSRCANTEIPTFT